MRSVMALTHSREPMPASSTQGAEQGYLVYITFLFKFNAMPLMFSRAVEKHMTMSGGLHRVQDHRTMMKTKTIMMTMRMRMMNMVC